MAAHFEEVSEENNKNILEKLNQLKKNKDSDENATFTDVLKGYLMKLNKWMITKEVMLLFCFGHQFFLFGFFELLKNTLQHIFEVSSFFRHLQY